MPGKDGVGLWSAQSSVDDAVLRAGQESASGDRWAAYRRAVLAADSPQRLDRGRRGG